MLTLIERINKLVDRIAREKRYIFRRVYLLFFVPVLIIISSLDAMAHATLLIAESIESIWSGRDVNDPL